MDPFISGPLGAIEGQVYNPASKGREGTLTLDLGDISEDVLRDSRLMFEQGLPVPGKQVEIDTTPFGKVPRAQIIQYGFDEDSYSRSLQDVGLDGLSNEEERSWFAGYLNEVRSKLNPEVGQRIESDPSNDDFVYYLNEKYDQEDAKILERYKNFNNLQNNSPVGGTGDFTPSYSNLPDIEDINLDNQLNQQDGYYSYKINLRQEQMVVGQNYILEKRKGSEVDWYHFRIPIQDLSHPNFGGTTGNVFGFRNIRFIRLRLAGMAEPLVLRFLKLQITEN